jgi:hypothetical protein
MTWTDWREDRMKIYHGVLKKNAGELIWREKISNSPSGSWLPSLLIDDEDFNHVFWLEFFKRGVRITYKNTRLPETTTFITQFMDAYGFMTFGELVQGLSLSIIVSLLISPIVLFSPSIIVVILSLLLVKRIIGANNFTTYNETLLGKWMVFPTTLGLTKLIVIAFKMKFYYSFQYQIFSSIFSFGLTLFIQKRRGNSVRKFDDWNSTTVIWGLLDGFFTAMPYILAYLTRLG